MPFTRKLSIGNRLLDTEHKRLLAMTQEIVRLVGEHNSGALEGAFRQLEDGLHSYFAAKEKVARSIDFDFSRQRQAQQNLLHGIRQIREKLSDDSSTSERGKILLADSLSDRLVHHFTVDCRPLKIVLDTHYYDFCPDSPVFA